MDGFLSSTDPGLIVAGIDPGLTGALAVLNESDDCETIDMPVMGAPAIVDGGAVARWLNERGVILVVVERSQAMPEHLQKRKQGAASTFRNGQTYGQLLGVLQASAFPYRIVGAADWKRGLRLPSSPEYAERKEIARRRAIELLPRSADQFQLKKNADRAEAALIAWWYLHGRTPFVAKIERDYYQKEPV